MHKNGHGLLRDKPEVLWDAAGLSFANIFAFLGFDRRLINFKIYENSHLFIALAGRVHHSVWTQMGSWRLNLSTSELFKTALPIVKPIRPHGAGVFSAGSGRRRDKPLTGFTRLLPVHFAYSQDQGVRVYDSGHLRRIANTLEQFRELQLGLAWGVPVTLGGAVIDCRIHSAAWRYGGTAGCWTGWARRSALKYFSEKSCFSNWEASCCPNTNEIFNTAGSWSL